MYILIPSIILVASLVGIAVIIGRKFVYLKKLTPEAINNPPATLATFWRGFFSEIVSWYAKINLREYRVKFMAESEKLLRRFRLLFLKIEGLMHRLINRLRRSTKRHEAILVKEEAEAKIEEAIASAPVVSAIDPKEEEQHLIMEIAKNPKDATLYQKLGDIYLKTGEKDNARMSFITVLDLDPENWYAKKKLADLA